MIPQLLQRLRQQLLAMVAPSHQPVVERLHSDAGAALFHLNRTATDRPIIAIVGGTGTGKSTLINRIVEADLSATSFRRTFTAGAVAIGHEPVLPGGWAGWPHDRIIELPARGQAGRVAFVISAQPTVAKLTLIDTPDIDGEIPEHHAQADRVFRWADAIIFLVTPEKYQMTELLPYYRLAQRYAIPVLFVMNKCDEAGAVADYEKILQQQGITSPTVYALSRDDSTWQPPLEHGLDALRSAITALRPTLTDNATRNRVTDLVNRTQDQLLSPLRSQRADINRASQAMRALGVGTEIDVHPMTRQLQRRMQQKSVLYLIGPQRILDRVKSMPALLVRLPRNVWDLARTGKTTPSDDEKKQNEAPDFGSVLVEQFQALQTRIDDALRSSPTLAALLQTSDWKLPTTRASDIANEEIEDLKRWLDTRWNATPRDTAMLQKILNLIPGGQKLTQYSEAAPYLLTVVCAAKGALFGHVDLMILGSYSIITWLTEKASNEVAARTRQTNANIASRFESLATEQIQRTTQWISSLAPSNEQLDELEKTLLSLSER